MWSLQKKAVSSRLVKELIFCLWFVSMGSGCDGDKIALNFTRRACREKCFRLNWDITLSSKMIVINFITTYKTCCLYIVGLFLLFFFSSSCNSFERLWNISFISGTQIHIISVWVGRFRCVSLIIISDEINSLSIRSWAINVLEIEAVFGKTKHCVGIKIKMEQSLTNNG